MVKVNRINISKGRKRKLYGVLCTRAIRVSRALVVVYHWREL